MIAALYVQRGGCYWDLPGVDPWDEERDARLYQGPWPVVAHPPCARWCQLAALVESLHPHLKRGEDGGCFEAALASVREHGGILEHPAYSDAWPAFGLLRPARGCWSQALHDPGWVTEVSQSAYGHRARKRTWLYWVGSGEPPTLDWSEPEHSLRVSNFETWGQPVEYMGARERSATPQPFRDLLLSLAEQSRD